MDRIGMAFSGGGSRAAAFHLGALRALHSLGVLPRVQVLSAVSGGALMAALWAYHPGTFDEFDRDARHLLRRGLERDIVTRALRPGAVARSLLGVAASVARPGRPHPVRTTTRTDALAAVLRQRAFGERLLHQTTVDTDIVLTTSDLVTGSAVRFGSAVSSSSRLGRIREPWTVADAVAASAAFPPLLPAMERTLHLEHRGRARRRAVLLADGGLYDNLGLSVLEPGRSSAYTDHVYDVDHVIACDAGRGPLEPKFTHFWASRMQRSLEILHQRSENHGRARLHEWNDSGRIHSFTMAYLGMRDDRLPAAAPQLIPRDRVASYPTRFAGVEHSDLDALIGRGETLIHALLPHYSPELVSGD